MRNFLLDMIAIGMIVTSSQVCARDLGQWAAADPEIRQWYQQLMQPDVPKASCCGEADAYWADETSIHNGKVFVIITDDRLDEPLGRPHIEPGTEFEVPPNKLKWGAGDQDKTPQKNPTGHGVVFISRGGYVFCYVQPGGV